MLLLIAACAAPPPTARPVDPPLSYPPAARDRMLRLALAEWTDWGALQVTEGEPRAPGAGPESDPANFPRVLAYWRAVPRDGWVIAENRARFRDGQPAWAEPPWSAAFISWVMAGAGVDVREFPASAAHADYVDALIRDAAAFPATAPFRPFLPRERAPATGDLVCADRSRTPIRDWRDRAGDAGRFRPMHCDIVVEAGAGFVDLVGGNVRDAVTRTRVPTDPAGYLLPEPPGAAVRFAVFENRLGRLPPWSAPP